MEEFTYQELLSFGSAMAIYFCITFPIYVMYIIDTCTQLVNKIKDHRIKRKEQK